MTYFVEFVDYQPMKCIYSGWHNLSSILVESKSQQKQSAGFQNLLNDVLLENAVKVPRVCLETK